MPDDVDGARLQAQAPTDGLLRSVPFALERAADDPKDGLTLVGHAAVFDTWTEINSYEGHFLERIRPGAFKKTIAENGTRVRLQFDHGTHSLIGSMPLGVIRKLREDDKGLYVEARLADNWLVQPVRDAIAMGAIDGMSFRFSVERESWAISKDPDEVPRRSVEEVRLYEAGPVVYPAYETADVGVRSRRIAEDLIRADDTTRQEVARLLTFGLPERAEPGTESTDSTESEESTRGAAEPPADAADGTSERAAEEEDAPPAGHPSQPHPKRNLPIELAVMVDTLEEIHRCDPALAIAIARLERERMRKAQRPDGR